MWISSEVVISDTMIGASYTTGEYANSYANVQVEVRGDFREKTAVVPAVSKVKSRLGTDGVVAVNTSGALATSGDTIREYRYSGSARHCTYTKDEVTYTLNVDSATCPNACYIGEEGTGFVVSSDSDFFVYMGLEAGQTLTCTTLGGIEMTANETNPKDGEVKNYIQFNNGEMWRIIGVFEEKKASGEIEELVKIVRDEPLLYEEVPTTYTYNNVEMGIKYQQEGIDMSVFKYANVIWNGSNYFNQTNMNDWTQASLRYYLNDETNGASSYYNSVGAIYKEMIETVEYSLGNVNYDTSAQVSYNAERSSTVHQGNQSKWQGKIGLMYPSDYGYAAGSENWTISMNMYGFATNTGANNNWLRDNNIISEWTISPDESSTDTAMTGAGMDDVSFVTNGGAVTPALYLKSSVMITGGNGSYQNPYQVAL